jgi:hypothetical protein
VGEGGNPTGGSSVEVVAGAVKFTVYSRVVPRLDVQVGEFGAGGTAGTWVLK